MRDLVGKVFNNLLVTTLVGRTKNGHAVYHCECDCGNSVEVLGTNLIEEKTFIDQCKKIAAKFK